MLDVVEIGGHSYHATPKLDDEGQIVSWDLILDENGEMIPSHVCLCSAYTASECCCGAWYRDNLIHYKKD
jgi:hypothetical protein